MRSVTQMSTALYPAPVQLRQRIETILSYAYREDLKDTTNGTDDSHPFFTFELNAYFVKDERGDAGIGLSYIRGEDPDDGLKQGDKWILSLKVRLK